MLDSTVIGGMLSVTKGLDVETVGLSAMAGAISVGMRYILNEEEGVLCTKIRFPISPVFRIAKKQEGFVAQWQQPVFELFSATYRRHVTLRL